MTDKPKTGRILPDLSQPEGTRFTPRQPGEQIEYSDGRTTWTEAELAEFKEIEEFEAFLREEEQELEDIKNSVPLGAARHVEPRSIHSPLPQLPWKRELRP